MVQKYSKWTKGIPRWYSWYSAYLWLESRKYWNLFQSRFLKPRHYFPTPNWTTKCDGSNDTFDSYTTCKWLLLLGYFNQYWNHLCVISAYFDQLQPGPVNYNYQERQKVACPRNLYLFCIWGASLLTQKIVLIFTYKKSYFRLSLQLKNYNG